MFLASLIAFIAAGVLLLMLLDLWNSHRSVNEENLLIEVGFLIGLLCMLFVAGHTLYGAINHLI